MRELNLTFSENDEIAVDDFFDIVILYDKLTHPDDYVPAEDILAVFK